MLPRAGGRRPSVTATVVSRPGTRLRGTGPSGGGRGECGEPFLVVLSPPRFTVTKKTDPAACDAFTRQSPWSAPDSCSPAPGGDAAGQGLRYDADERSRSFLLFQPLPQNAGEENVFVTLRGFESVWRSDVKSPTTDAPRPINLPWENPAPAYSLAMPNP